MLEEIAKVRKEEQERLRQAQEEFENKFKEAQTKHLQELIANQDLKEKQVALAAKIAQEQKEKEERDRVAQLAAKKAQEEEEKKRQALLQAEENKRKAAAEEAKKLSSQVSKEVIQEEEEVEEEDESIETPPKQKDPEPPAKKVVVPPIPLNLKKSKEEVRSILTSALQSDTNKFEGQQMVLKSLFDHPEAELRQLIPIVQDDAKVK